jgi:hypothetical protein
MKRIIAITSALLVITGIAFAKDIKTYKAIYEKELETIILSHGMRMTHIGQQYSKSLEALLAKVKKAGDLDKTTVVMGEITRFQNEKGIPKEPSALLDLQNLQSSFIQQTSAHEVDKAKKIISLTSRYDQALERLQKSLVSSSKIDGARTVQTERGMAKESETYKRSLAAIKLSSQASLDSKPRLERNTHLGANKSSDNGFLTIPQSIKMTSLEPLSVGSLGVPASATQNDRLPKINGKNTKDVYFAHAPSTLAYSIPEGMRSVSGYACCADDTTQDGVIFIIEIDEKQAYKSKATRGWNDVMRFSINIPDGAQEISFIADENINPHGDHSYWINVVFSNKRSASTLRRR